MDNYYNRNQLLSVLTNSSKFHELHSENGASIVVSEYGGRPLGLFPSNESLSLLWINPELQETISSRRRDIGGDRYWISPEQKFFYKKPSTWEGWFCPEGLDPANYEIIESNDKSCKVSSNITVTNQFTHEIYQGEVIRSFELIKEPFETGLSFVGLETKEECSLTVEDSKLNGWNLATVISCGKSDPGTVIVPTRPDPEPLSYFRMIPEDRIQIGETFIAFKIDVDDVYKLAVKPEDIDFELPVKIGYITKMPDNNKFGFLVKLSEDLPTTQSDCFDVSRDHPNCDIGVVQSYNSHSPDSPLLNYGEIELQLDRFKINNGVSKGKSTHKLFGYVGSKEEIIDIAKKYLNVKKMFLF